MAVVVYSAQFSSTSRGVPRDKSDNKTDAIQLFMIICTVGGVMLTANLEDVQALLGLHQCQGSCSFQEACISVYLDLFLNTLSALQTGLKREA